MKILIIEDQELEREHLVALLTQGPHSIIAATHGEEAIEIHRDKKCDLVITDFRMPGMNGLDVIEAIRSEDAGVRIWMASSYLHPNLIDSAKNLGAEKVLWKSGLEHELFMAGIIT